MLASLIAILLIFSGHASAAHQCSCGIENPSTRVIGGTVVSENQYPWMAALVLYSPYGTMLCGGSIINDRYILTAGHCIDGVYGVYYAVGSNRAPAFGTLQSALSWSKHELYNPFTKHNDIALVKLAEPLQFSDSVRPICLPTASQSTAGELTVAGWGQTEKGRPSDKLLHTTVTEYDWNKCNTEWSQLMSPLVRSQFCAAEIGKASCMGDSGGPLMTKKSGKTAIAGIVSFGLRECGISRNAVYTKVSSHLDWIKRHTSDGIPCAN